jgi:hypothetical protein
MMPFAAALSCASFAEARGSGGSNGPSAGQLSYTTGGCVATRLISPGQRQGWDSATPPGWDQGQKRGGG